MWDIRLLFCLVAAVCGAWANSEDGSDLNLESIFRTPKDFSKVNFDHFELLERNNFNDKENDHSIEHEDKKAEEPKADDKKSKSVANAQVMLRIGGEDIHDCNRVILHNPFYTESLPLPSDDIYYPRSSTHAAYSSSFKFPGCHYGSKSLPQYSTFSSQGSKAVPHEYEISAPETHITQERPGDEERCLEHLKREEIIVEKPCGNEIEKIEVTNVQEEPCDTSEQKIYVTASGQAEPTVVDTSCASENNAKDSAPECVPINNIHATTVEPNPSPTKVSYAEVNLADIGKQCFDSPKDDIATLLDQALVPFSCQKCSRSNSFLVSYPIVTNDRTVTVLPEEEVVSECPSCHGVFCHSCNRERNPEIPYGHRFSKDIDSLFEIADNSPELYVPPSLYNDAPSEKLVKIQRAPPPVKLSSVSTVFSKKVECQPELSFQKTILTPETKESLQTPESTCEKEEDVQETPCSETITSVATPSATTKLVTVEVPQVVEKQENHETDLSDQSCQQKTTETIKSPRVTQEVVQINNPCNEPSRIQHPYNEIYNTASEVPHYDQVYREYYPQDTVQTVNPYAEVGNSYYESPYSTQEAIQVSNPHQEIEQPVFQSGSFETAYTKPGSQSATFYSDEGSAPFSNVFQVDNSYNQFSNTVPHVDHTITIQPVYRSFSTEVSEVPSYQSLLTNLYPQKEITPTFKHYTQSPCKQELVQSGNSFHQVPYMTQEIVQSVNDGIETISAQPSYNSYNHGPYTVQEVTHTSNPCSGTFTVQAGYDRVQGGKSYDHIPYNAQQLTQERGLSGYNRVFSIPERNTYHQPACTTQEIVQKYHPSHKTVTTQPEWKNSHIDVRSSYEREGVGTQEIVRTGKVCPETVTIRTAREAVPFITVRNFCNQAPYPTQVYKASSSQPESGTSSSACSVNSLQVGNSYNQISYGAQQASQTSYPCSQAFSIQSIFNRVPTAAQYQTQYPKQSPCTSYAASPYSTQHSVQVSSARPETSLTVPTVYNNVPAVQVGNSYNQATYGAQQVTQTTYPCSQQQSVINKVPTVAQYQNAYSKYYTPASYTASPYTVQHNIQVSIPRPETTVTTETAHNTVPSVQVGTSYNQAPYGAQQACQTSSQSNSFQSYFNKVLTAAQSEYSKPFTQTSYPVNPCTTQNSVQVSSTYPETTSVTYTIADSNTEKPQVYFSPATGNSQSQLSEDNQAKLYLDGYKVTSGTSCYSDGQRSILHKQPPVVDSFKGYPSLPCLQHSSAVGAQRPTVQASQYSSPALPAVHQVTQSVHPFYPPTGNYKAPVAPVYQHPGLGSNVPCQPKVSQPHIYKIVGKYDNVPQSSISALNIPDLIPTNQYLKIDRPVCQGQQVNPVVPARNEAYTQSYGYSQGWPFWNNGSFQRQGPLAPNYYPVCGAFSK